MSDLINDLLHNHSRTGLLLNELAYQLKTAQNQVRDLETYVQRLRDERDRLQNDLEFRAMSEQGKH